MAEEIAARVAAIIARTRKIPVESVTLEKSFEDLNIDSLDGINIMFEIEGELGVDIPDEDAKHIRTVRQMVEGIENLLAAKAKEE
jgi:acyl carrier protein